MGTAWHQQGAYLDGLLGGPLLVVFRLLMLLAALGQVGVVGQTAEERRHHWAGVHFLLHHKHTHTQTCINTTELNMLSDALRVARVP